LGVTNNPASTGAFQNRGSASYDINLALPGVGLEGVAKDRPAHVACYVGLDFERAVPEILHLPELRRQMVIAVVCPPPVYTGAFHDGEPLTRVQSIERGEVVPFRRGEQRGDGTRDGLLVIGSWPDGRGRSRNTGRRRLLGGKYRRQTDKSAQQYEGAARLKGAIHASTPDHGLRLRQNMGEGSNW